MKARWSYGWNVVACAVVFQALVIGTTIYGTAFLIKAWCAEFAAPRGDVVLASVLWQAGMGLAAPFVGRLLDLFPMRRLVLIGLALLAGGLLLISRATALWQIVAVYGTVMALAALLAGAMTAQALAAKWFVERRGLALGIAALGTSAGGLLIPQILVPLVAGHGWRAALVWIAAGTVAVMMPVVWVVLAREPEGGRAAQATRGGTAASAGVWTTPMILASRDFWTPVVSLTLLALTCQGVQINIAAHAQDSGFSPGSAASLLSILSLGMVAGKLVIGALADRIDDRRLYWFACSVTLAGFPALASSATMALLMLGAACTGFAFGAVLTLLAATLAARFGAASFGRVIGLAYLVLNASALGPLLAGVVFDRTSSYSGAFVAFVAINVLGMLLMMLHRRAPQPQQAV